MSRVLISKKLNLLFLGEADELLCARVYANHKKHGGAWTQLMKLLDWCFTYQEDQHCRRCWVWQIKEEKRNAMCKRPLP